MAKVNFLKKYKFLNLQTLIGSLAILLIGGLIAFTASEIIESKTQAAKENLILASQDIASQVSLGLNKSFEFNRFNATLLKTTTYNSPDHKMSRGEVITLLHEQLIDNPEFLALWTVWEPNAFDNKDFTYKNQVYHDSTGRFIPYIVRSGKNISVEPCLYYDGPKIMDYYLLPKTTKKEIIVEPYVYPIDGKNELIITTLTPILIDGEFRGVAGTDFLATFLQGMIDNFKPNESESAIITTKGTVVAMAGHPEFIGKNIAELPDSFEKSFIKGDLQSSIFENEEIIKVCTLIRLGNTDTPWQICVSLPRSAIIANATIVAGEIFLLIGIVIAFVLLIRSQIKFKKAAEKSEITLQSIIGNLNQSIWTVDTQKRLSFLNSKFKTSFKEHFNKDIELGGDVLEGLNEYDRNYWNVLYQKALSGEPNSVAYELSNRHFQVSLFPILLKEKITGVFAISYDITESIQQENAIKEIEAAAVKRENTLQTIMSGLNHSIWAVDRNYNYTIFNWKFIQNIKTVYNIDVKHGANFREGLSKEDQKFWQSMYDRCFQGEQINFDKKYGEDRFFQYSFLPITVNNEITGAFAMSHEVTEKIRKENELKKIEQAAQKSETTLQSLVNNLRNSVWAIDTDFCLIFFNENYKNNIKSIYNIDIELGKPLLTDFPLEEKEYWSSIFSKALKGERIDLDVNRRERTFQFSINPIIVNKEVTGIFIISLEITDKIKQEEAVRKSEITLNSILGNMKDAFWAIDKNGKYTHFNDKHRQNVKGLFGVDIKVGEGIPAIVAQKSPDLSQLMNENYFKALQGTPMNFEIKFSEEKYSEYSMFPINTSDEVSGVLVFSKDISEKVIQQEKLRINEEKYRNLSETSPAAIVIIDTETGKIIEANKMASTLFKYSYEDLVKLGPDQLSPKYQDDGGLSETSAKNYINRAANGEELVFDWTHMDSQGTLIPAQVYLSTFPSSNKKLVRGTVIDITERVKHQEELKTFIDFQAALIDKVKEQEASLSALINSTSDYIFSLDNNLNLTEYNDAFRDVIQFAYGMNLAKGMNIRKFVAPELVERNDENLSKALTGKTVKDTLHYKSKNETEHYIDNIYSPIFSDTNEVIGVTVISRDITENKEAEKKIVEINKQIAEYKLMALRSVMNPHFLFNSLNSIQYFVATNERKLALDYLSMFSALIRKILNSSVNNAIPLNTELEILENYIKLEKLRFEDKFDFSIEVSDEIIKEDIEIPSLLIQPYVENAILHGLMNKESGKGILNIKVDIDKDCLYFIVEDNGVGRIKATEIKTARNIKEKSYGMLLTKERLDIINKTANVSVKIEDLVDDNQNPEGTKVSIQIHI